MSSNYQQLGSPESAHRHRNVIDAKIRLSTRGLLYWPPKKVLSQQIVLYKTWRKSHFTPCWVKGTIIRNTTYRQMKQEYERGQNRELQFEAELLLRVLGHISCHSFLERRNIFSKTCERFGCTENFEGSSTSFWVIYCSGSWISRRKSGWFRLDFCCQNKFQQAVPEF